MKQLKEGDKAPAFEGINQDGNTIRLNDLKGKKVILYFYPKDDTPGCTAEACSLRDNHSELAERGFEVIGVSPDDETILPWLPHASSIQSLATSIWSPWPRLRN